VTFGFIDATYRVVATLAPQLELYGSAGTISVRRRDRATALQVYRVATRARAAAPGRDHGGRAARHRHRLDRRAGDNLLTPAQTVHSR
jgi:hypothetical protein